MRQGSGRTQGLFAWFIDRPVATILMMVAICFVGLICYPQLPIASVPEIDFPTIQISATLPGASAETMAASVAQPLERELAKISGVAEMTSSSSLGTMQIIVQFDLSRTSRDVTSDVQTAISSAAGDLPKNLPSPPIFNRANPADFPVMQLSATSDVLELPQVDELIETRIAQRISSIAGVGRVNIGGRQKPAIRIAVDPGRLLAAGVTLEDVRAAVGLLSVLQPKGNVDDKTRTFPIITNDQLSTPLAWGDAVIAYRNGGPVRLRDIGTVTDGPENAKSAHWTNGVRGIAIDVFREPGSNVVKLVDTIKAQLPALQASLPSTVKLALVTDRTVTIRASVVEIQFTLLLTIALVVMVIFIFLRNLRATLIPSLAVPIALIGTAAPMWVLGYSIDNLSLMAMVVAVGFVVDDAIVVLENITRHVELGETPRQAAINGVGEVGFTIMSISVSLVAVLIPLLLMGGIVGRLFREFAIALTMAIFISAIVSLTLTPMLAARLLKPHDTARHGRLYRISERGFDRLQSGYVHLLDVALRHRGAMLLLFLGTTALTGFLFVTIPKGFFPEQDTGFIGGLTQASPDISYPEMVKLQERVGAIVLADPAVYSVFMDVGGDNGGSALNQGHVNITLRPRAQRDATAQQVMARLRPQLMHEQGIQLFMQAAQDINIGARPARTRYQYTLQDSNIAELTEWSPKLLEALRTIPGLVDIGSDQQALAPTLTLQIDRAAAALYGVLPATIDDTLYDAFGQRQVGQYTTQTDTFHVVLEVLPALQHDLETLDRLAVRGAGGTLVPLANVAKWATTGTAPVSINHQEQFPAVTLSFDLAPGVALGQAVSAVQKTFAGMNPPASLSASFSGSAKAFEASLSTVPLLIAAALVVVYLILGMLYESFVHPLTILSTLPSAALGALVALRLGGFDFGLIAMIGVILLIGIVKKNGIMIVDFALQAKRQGRSSEDAIREACALRFRPILMTTAAAILTGIPLMLGHGIGSEIRQPLGYAIVGGLLVSQLLTMFSTPVIYLLLDRIIDRGERARQAEIVKPLPTATLP